MMATAKRASPQTMRCSPCHTSGPTPAQRPPNQTRPLKSRGLQRKWTFLAWMGGTSAARVLHPNLRLLQPQPPTSLGTCLGGHPSQPVGRRLPSPPHIKLPQTPLRPVHLLHHQVQDTKKLSVNVFSQCLYNCCKYYTSNDGIMLKNPVKRLFSSAFNPFGAGPMPKPQDVMGSFLGPGNVGQTDPFLHAARSPSPTLQPASLGKLCSSGSASHSHILDAVSVVSG